MSLGCCSALQIADPEANRGASSGRRLPPHLEAFGARRWHSEPTNTPDHAGDPPAEADNRTPPTSPRDEAGADAGRADDPAGEALEERRSSRSVTTLTRRSQTSKVPWAEVRLWTRWRQIDGIYEQRICAGEYSSWSDCRNEPPASALLSALNWFLLQLIAALMFMVAFVAAGMVAGPGSEGATLLNRIHAYASYLVFGATPSITAGVFFDYEHLADWTKWLFYTVRFSLPFTAAFVALCEGTSAQESLHLLYVLGPLAFVLILFPAIEATRLVAGDPKYWSPIHIKPTLALLEAYVAASVSVLSTFVPLIYLCVDSLYLANGDLPYLDLKSQVIIQIRPLLVMAMKRLTCTFMFFGLGVIHLPHFTIHVVLVLYYIFGLSTACSVGGCRDWLSVVAFIACDWASFLFRFWVFSGHWEDKRLAKFVRQRFHKTKVRLPDGVEELAFRGYDLLAEDMGNTTGFLLAILLYPVALAMRQREDMLFNLLYPEDESLAYISLMFASEFLQDRVVHGFVQWKTGETYSRYLGKAWGAPTLRTLFITIGASQWTVFFLVWTAFLLKH